MLVCRTESSGEDLQAFIDEVNRRRANGLPELQNRLKWVNTASKTSDGTLRTNRHVPKNEECGVKCLERVAAYYKDDFEHLRYPSKW